MKSKLFKWSVIAILILHLVVSVLLFWPQFSNKTQAMITGFPGLCLLYTFFWEKPLKALTIVILTGIILCAFAIEFAALKTGWIFGKYIYGHNLGYAWKGMPLLTAIIWGSITFYSAQIRFQIKSPSGRALISSFLMTLFLIVFEYASNHFHYRIRSENIPVQSYIFWFIISFLFQLALQYSGLPGKNKMGAALFWIQLGTAGAVALAILI